MRETRFGSGYRGFLRFASSVGLDLEPFQRRIVRTVFGADESLVLISRGNGKSCLIGCLAVWHLLTTPRAAVYLLASSREQARVVYEYARDFALHPAVAERIVVRHLELRAPDGGHLRVLASDAPKLHGLSPTFAVVDELHALASDEPYLALRTAMAKRPGAKMVTISTAGVGADSPLGKLRSRALASPVVKRQGSLTTCTGGTIDMLEWAAPEDADIASNRVAKSANPASWLTASALAAQRAALPETAYRRFHLGQWVATEALPFAPGAWQACAGETEFESGEEIVIAVDASKGASDAAVVWLNERGHVGIEIWEGTGSAQAVDEIVGELAERYTVREVASDPWHVVGLLTERWEQRGLVVSEWPQYDSRVVPATERLIRAVNGHKLTHPNDERLNAHVEGSMLRDTRRGPRLDKRKGRNNDGVVALLMAWDRQQNVPEPVKVLAWVG
jgi:phage terminase large subunit-like protein